MAEAKERKLPAPAISDETQAYWDAAGKGKLLVRKCTACGQAHHYPRTICPHCFSDRTEWTESGGRGTIYSFSVMRRAPEPYVMAYVTLAEGPTMMTNIVDCDPKDVFIGMDVEVVFDDVTDEVTLPKFKPVK